MISLISGGCQVRKSLFHILRYKLTGKINLSEPIPCKLAAMVCGLAKPFHRFIPSFLREEQLPEGVLREIITGFCRAPKPLLCLCMVTQGGKIIPIELTKLMCRNGISLLPELLQRFDRFCVFRIQRIDVLQDSLYGAVTLRLLVHTVGLMLLLLTFRLRVILHSFILKGREAETNALGLPDDVVLDFAELLALR